MLLRLFLLLLALGAFLISLYRWGWDLTLQTLRRWGLLLLEDCRRLWKEAQAKASSGSSGRFGRWLPLLQSLRFFVFALRRLYFLRFRAIPLVDRFWLRSQGLFPWILLLAVVLSCGAKYFLWGSPLVACLVHLCLGCLAVYGIRQSYRENHPSVQIISLNLGFCYLYGLLFLLFLGQPLLFQVFTALPPPGSF